MSFFLPDCGVLSSPSNNQSLRKSLSASKLANRLDQIASTPPARLGAGSGVCFYKSPSSTPSSVRTTPSPQVQARRSKHRPSGAINKGVGHGIKKPKINKAKDKKAKNPAKVSVRRLKNVKPPPRLAQHRSPAPNTPGAVKKKHRLSSPGISLLEGPDTGSDFMPSTSNEAGGKSFFTSRARAAATVHISKNVMLSADYGHVSLNKSGISSGLKKNIGGTSTELPPAPPAKVSTSTQSSTYRDPELDSNKPKPTRFNGFSSPARKSTAPVSSSPKNKNLLRSNNSTTNSSPNKRNQSSLASQSGVRSSPRRAASIAASNSMSPARSKYSHGANSSPGKTPTKRNGEVSPRTLVLSRNTPTKVCTSIRSSPRRNKCSPNKVAANNVVIQMVHQSPEPKAMGSPSRLKLTPVRSSPRRLAMSSPLKPYMNDSSNGHNLLDDSELQLEGESDLESLAELLDTPTKYETRSKQNTPIKQLTPSKQTIKGYGSPAKQSPAKNNRTPLKTNSTNVLDEEGNDNKPSKYFEIFDPEKRKCIDKNSPKKQRLSKDGSNRNPIDNQQMILDAGQKEFGAKQCPQCSMLYDRVDPDDFKAHHEYHNRIMSLLSYKRSAQEHQVSLIDSKGGRCVMIQPKDPKHRWEKVIDVLSVINEELGFSEDNASDIDMLNNIVIFYILEHKVAGCLVAEKVDYAYRVIPPSSVDNTEDKENDFLDTGLMCCSDEKCKVLFGISRIWVRNDCRRSGLATTLIDSFRRNAIFPHYLQVDQFAFSDPTPSGYNFAKSYTKRNDFLVYRRD